MSTSATHPNNARVKFRGQGEREMAKEMVPLHGVELAPVKTKRAPGPKHAKRMRKRAKSAAKRGLISDKAMAKMEGGGGY